MFYDATPVDYDQKHIERLKIRARIVDAIREFFGVRGYLEVDTPLRVPVLLPEAHILPVTSEGWFLQSSPEQCMKRMVSAGCERIFQVCKAFRGRERGCRHLPEFTILEWYRVGADYMGLMAETAELVRHVAAATGCGSLISYKGSSIDLGGEWAMLSVSEAFERYAGVSLESALATGMYDELMGIEIEPRLGHDRPVFLCDYPQKNGASFARPKADNPKKVERFELYIAGLELCNGFSELTGSQNYRQRFESENARRSRAGMGALPTPERFLSDMDRMPETGGNALGVDRLVMLFCGVDDIGDVVAFPPESL